MKTMGWTWQELQETDSEIVGNVWRYMQTEAKHEELKRG